MQNTPNKSLIYAQHIAISQGALTGTVIAAVVTACIEIIGAFLLWHFCDNLRLYSLRHWAVHGSLSSLEGGAFRKALVHSPYMISSLSKVCKHAGTPTWSTTHHIYFWIGSLVDGSKGRIEMTTWPFRTALVIKVFTRPWISRII